QPAIAASERQSGNADLGIGAARNRQTEGLGCSVEFAPQNSALSARASVFCIDFNRLHERKIDHQSIITDRCTSTTVSTTPHCDENTVFAGKAHRDHDVRFVCTKCH